MRIHLAIAFAVLLAAGCNGLLTEPNQTYDVSFAKAPAGTYRAYCIPHVALGMKIAITVR